MQEEGEHLGVGPRTKGVQLMAPWSVGPVLSPTPQEASCRRCTHCGTEKTPRSRLGPDGPGTLCNVCGHPRKNLAVTASSKNTLSREGQLLLSNSCLPLKKRRHSSKENNSAAGNDVGASLDAFFNHTVEPATLVPLLPLVTGWDGLWYAKNASLFGDSCRVRRCFGNLRVQRWKS